MGLDVEIHLRGELSPQLVGQINKHLSPIINANDAEYGNFFEYGTDGAARFRTMWRYWGRGYERGPWDGISFVLHVVMGFPGVDEVRYGHDSGDDPEVMTPDRLSELWDHYRSPDFNNYNKASF